MAVDSFELVWGLLVFPADVQDLDGGCWLLGAVWNTLRRVWEVVADRGFSRRFGAYARPQPWRVTTTATAAAGFAVQPRRWVVEMSIHK